MEVVPEITSVGYHFVRPPKGLSGSLAQEEITVSIHVFPSWSRLGSIVQSSVIDGIVFPTP